MTKEMMESKMESNIESGDLAREKQKKRNIFLQKRKDVSSQNRKKWDNQIRSNLIQSSEFNEANYLFCYVGFDTEVATEEIIQYSLELHKKVYVPRVIDEENMEFFQIFSLKDLKPGKFHIQEPLENENLLFTLKKLQDEIMKPEKNVLMLLPGLVFDKKGVRIGYGRGYYDRYLHRLFGLKKSESIPFFLMGIGYQFQLVEALIPDKNDFLLHAVCTNERIIYV